MNYEYQSIQERREILSDLPRFVQDARIMGAATKFDNEDHMVIRFRILPTIKYFLKEKDDDSDEYLIFSGKSFQNKSVRFYNKVGSAEKISEEFIKLIIPDLKLICYLRMTPKDQVMESPAA